MIKESRINLRIIYFIINDIIGFTLILPYQKELRISTNLQINFLIGLAILDLFMILIF